MAEKNYSVSVGEKLKQYAGGGPYNLVTDSPMQGYCAREILMCVDGDLTSLKDANGVEMGPFTGLKQNLRLNGHFTSVTPTAAIIVVW